jgi:hypothetical protein
MHSPTPQVTYVSSARSATEVPVSRVAESRRLDLRYVRRFGLAVFALQLVALLVWSGFQAGRAAQGADFVGFYQSWYLIAHGVLDPSNWWQAQGIFIQWPLATLALIWPHPVTLLIVQDVAIVGAEVVAYLWICDLVAERESVPLRGYALTGLALLALDPWIYWSASWDYHSEPLGTLFAVLAARELFRGRRIAWLWCGITLLCGMVPATYLIGIGICLLMKHRRRMAGLAVIAIGALWFLVLTALGAGKTLGAATTSTRSAAQQGVAGGLSSRVSEFLPNVAHHATDLFANLAPAGFIGVFTAPVAGIAGLILGENFSQDNQSLVVPTFQGLPLYVFVPVGTILALMWLNRRAGRRFAHTLAVLMLVNVTGWAVVWLPEVVPTWLLVSSSEAAAIKHVEAMIPQQDGVVASQGISGDFANHSFIRLFFRTPFALPVASPYTWFVVAPYAGIETATIQQGAQLIAGLARDPDAKLEYSHAGVWAFRVPAPRKAHSKAVLVRGGESQFSAALFSTAGTAIRRGDLKSWYVEGSNRTRGPILWGDYYLEEVGRYRAGVTLAGSGSATVQVWDDTSKTLLSSLKTRVSSSTHVTLPARVTRSDPRLAGVAKSGTGLFQIDPVPAYLGNYLEVKVFATSAATVKVRAVSLRPVAT